MAARVFRRRSSSKSRDFINVQNVFYVKTGNTEKAQLINEHNLSQMISFHINLHLLA